MSGLRWWWIRHAPTGLRVATGWSDPPARLDDAVALDALAQGLPDAPLISSDLERARATADRIASGRRRLQDSPALRELNFGAWEGLTYDEAKARDPEAYRAFFADPGPAATPGGECFDALRARIAAETGRLNAEVAEGDLIAVAHAGAVQAALAQSLGLAPRQALGFVIAPLSVTRLDWIAETGDWRVVCVNAPPSAAGALRQ